MVNASPTGDLMLNPQVRAYLRAADGHMLFKDAVLELVTSFEMTPEQAGRAICAYTLERCGYDTTSADVSHRP